MSTHRTWIAIITVSGLVWVAVIGAQFVVNAAPVTPGAVTAAAAAAIVSWEYDQIQPAVAHSAQTNTFLAVWEDHHWGWGADWDIYGRRVVADGVPMGTLFGIAWEGANQRLNPDVAYNAANGEFLVVWEYEYSTTDHDIYARRVSGDGTLPGNELLVSNLTSFESAPVVAYNAVNDEYLVVWTLRSGSDDFTHGDLYARRVDADGALLGSAIVIASGSLDESAPALAYNAASNQYLVVWQDKQAGSGEYDIHGQRLGGSNGAPVGGEINLSTWEYDQLKPRLVHNSVANEYLVVWEDHHWGWGADWDVFGQRVSASGALAGSNFAISWDGANHRESPAVAYAAAANEYLVAWEYEYNTSDHDVYRRRVKADGSLPEGEVALSILSASETRPALASDGNWTYLAAWEDGRDSAAQGINLYDDRVRLYQLSGRVFNGNAGDESAPLPGATVELYCSNNANDLGTRVASAVADGSGWYGLTAVGVCEYYNLWEADPPGYVSVGATSVSGVGKSASWIQYAYPLEGKTLTGNKFWDRPGVADTPTPSRTPTSTSTSTLTPTRTPAPINVSLCAVADAFLQQQADTNNTGGLAGLNIGYNTLVDTYHERALIRFDLSGIPSGAVVQSASLQLYLTGGQGNSPVTIGAYQVTGTWTESGVNWSNQPSISSSPAASVAVGTVAGYKSWDVKSLAQGWINDSLPNHGVELRGPETDWWRRAFSSREGAHCPLLVLSVHSSAPVLTPTPTATTAPSPTPTTPPAPVSRGVQIVAVEINQAVQDQNTLMVPLIAGKKAVVRVHLKVTDGLGDLAGVRGYLHFPCPGGGIYSPINSGGAMTARANPDRGKLDHSLNFVIPASAAQGSNTLLVRVLPPAGVTFPGIGELQDARLVTFGSVPAMRLQLVGVEYVTNTVSYTPRNIDYARAEAWLRAAYPIGSLISTRSVISYTGSMPTCGGVNKLLGTLKLMNVLLGNELPATRYHGLVFEGPPAWYGMEGCCCSNGASSGPTGSATYGWDFDGSFGDWYAGHEIGHGYGLCHPGFCGEITSSHCVKYPYPGGLIGGPATDPIRFYGFDVETMQVYGPTSSDMMTYCDNQWISDFHYGRIRSKMLSPTLLSIVPAAPQDMLLVAGMVNTQTNAVTLDPFLYLPAASSALARTPGDYLIALTNASGVRLAEYPFTPVAQQPEQNTQGVSCRVAAAELADIEPAVIFEMVPWQPGTARVGIWHNGQELAGRDVSAHAPTVQVLSPNGGEVMAGDTLTITWSAGDTDGDALTFTLFYSADNGQTWATLATGVMGTSYVADARLLPGSSSAMVRVLASDGVNTAFDQSNAGFTQPGRGPQVEILWLAEGVDIAPDGMLALSGDAYDPESGALSGAALVWESDHAGQLGSGSPLILSGRDLSPGWHRLTLRATDAQGLTAEASVNVYVGYRLHLPVILKR